VSFRASFPITLYELGIVFTTYNSQNVMSQLIHFEYHRPGIGKTVYDEWLVLDRPDVKVLLQKDYSGPDVDVAGSRILDSGAPMVWFVFPDSWHDIGRFHLSDGTFTGWYTNLCKPVQFEDDTWIGHDLFLDLWQFAVGDVSWLDEDEFAEAVKTGLVDRQLKKQILNQRALIDLQVKLDAWPPPIAKDIDLVQAEALLGT
jgi:predicted RNA-binding protein associated with RNAse of E/G family